MIDVLTVQEKPSRCTTMQLSNHIDELLRFTEPIRGTGRTLDQPCGPSPVDLVTARLYCPTASVVLEGSELKGLG